MLFRYSRLMMQTTYPSAVLFDLLTALLDSWTLWDAVAGSEAKGRAWRAEYLRLTYGSGVYLPYEKLVRVAARTVGLSDSVPQALEDRWCELKPWEGVQETLDALQGRTRLAIVTNCSNRLGLLAANQLKTNWDCVVTAEEAGHYKPDPRPYRLALERLGVSASNAVFVAGSGYDLFGTSAVGLRTYWHNRIGLKRPEQAPPAAVESQSIEFLIPWLEGQYP
jgi:2-haloalkanoic acid dehalogenase type II